MTNNFSDFGARLTGCNILPETIKNKKFLITGATGLIGSSLAVELLDLSKQKNLNLEVALLVRNESKLNPRLKEFVAEGGAKVYCTDVAQFTDVDFDADYIVHAASITASKLMVENPVEVIWTNVCGTRNVLEYAMRHKVKSVVYLSSMEAYGFTTEEVVLTEDKTQYLNPLAVRSSYPESKRMAENLCVSYFSEYAVPVKIIRLAQTFGSGVEINDTRVFAEFARCAVNEKDIVILTSGTSKRMYLDVQDALTAIVSVLLNGNDGEAYNAANKDTYCSIVEMAELVCKTVGGGKIKVVFDGGSTDVSKFPPAHKMYLDTSKLEKLGWKAYSNLSDCYSNMIKGWN